MISENPYMQYFLGLDYFNSKPVFDPSLFVHIRKCLGSAAFNKMNQIIISKALSVNEVQECESSKSNLENESDFGQKRDTKIENKEKLQMDATVCDAHIKFPTDLTLLNDAREASEKLIDIFCKSLNISKPRTYRIVARKKVVEFIKKEKEKS